MERLGFEKRKSFTVNHNNTRVTATIGGKLCKFRSKLEHNYAVYLQFLKEQGQIKDWNFEQMNFIFKDEIKGAKSYLVDFDVLNNDGTFEHHETKGWLKGVDVTKFRRVAKYWPEAKMILIMSGKSSKDANRLRMMAKYTERIVYASELFKPLRGFLGFI